MPTLKNLITGEKILKELSQKLQEGLTVTIKVKIIPGSSKNQIMEAMADGKVKIKITAVPEKGKANEALIKYMALLLNVPKQNIQITHGLTSPLKSVQIVPTSH